MNIVLNSVTGCFFRCLKQRAYINIKAYIGKCRGDNLGAAVMAILTQLNDQYAWTSAMLGCKFFNILLNIHEVAIPFVG